MLGPPWHLPNRHNSDEYKHIKDFFEKIEIRVKCMFNLKKKHQHRVWHGETYFYIHNCRDYDKIFVCMYMKGYQHLEFKKS